MTLFTAVELFTYLNALSINPYMYQQQPYSFDLVCFMGSPTKGCQYTVNMKFENKYEIVHAVAT